MSEITEATLSKFSAVYAEAVLTFLDSGEAQWVLWDRKRDTFDFSSIELDQPLLPVLLFVDASWTRVVEPDAVHDPERADYDPEALRSAIEHELLNEGIAERALKKYSERMDNSDEDEEAEEPEPPAEDDDA